MKRKRLIAPLVAIVVFCLVALSACGGTSDEELIRADLTAQFDEVKEGGETVMQSVEESAGDDFEALGVDPTEFAESFLEGFDYDIGDISVEDSAATAEVTITVKSMGDVMDEFQESYTAYLDGLAETPSDDEAYAEAGQLLMDAVDAAEPKETDCTFTYTKDDSGAWSADDSAATELVNALMA